MTLLKIDTGSGERQRSCFSVSGPQNSRDGWMDGVGGEGGENDFINKGNSKLSVPPHLSREEVEKLIYCNHRRAITSSVSR